MLPQGGRRDAHDVVAERDNGGRPHECAERKPIDRAAGLEKVTRRIHVCARVGSERDARKIGARSTAQLGMWFDADLRIPGIHHAAVRHWNRDIEYPRHSGNLSDWPGRVQ